MEGIFSSFKIANSDKSYEYKWAFSFLILDSYLQSQASVFPLIK